jgi:hypothetical protein
VKAKIDKPNYCLSSKSAVGLFLFSFFEPKSLLETSHRLAANNYIYATKLTKCLFLSFKGGYLWYVFI